MRTLNLVQYAAETGGTTDADVLGHIHAGLRSVPPTKTYRKFFADKLAELQAKRHATLEAYEAAIDAGEIARPPTPTLEERAKGEGPAAEAAQRLIAKREARLAAKAAQSEGEDTSNASRGKTT